MLVGSDGGPSPRRETPAASLIRGLPTQSVSAGGRKTNGAHEVTTQQIADLPEATFRMTHRARWYLTIASARHLLVGTFALLAAESFKSSSFIPILRTAPLWAWAVAFLITGAVCGVAAATGSEWLARLGMAWSATSTLLVGVGMLLAVFTGQLSSPTGPILWLAVALKDFVVCAQPMLSPFEGLADQIVRKRKR